MFQAIIHRLLERRHFWRVADFGELSELYATRLLRALAVNMVSIFVLIYLLQNGYGLVFALGYSAIYMATRALFVWPSAYLIARIGPKHGTLVSNLLYIPALISLSFLPESGMSVLVGFGLLQAASVSLYDISYSVNFSKIKHVDHAGKELSFMYMFEKIATALSPLIGGAIATLFGAQWTLYGAAFVFFIAAAPLLFSPEPVKTHQRIRFTGINWRLIGRNLVSQVSVGIDAGASGGVWSLFLALIVFAGSGSVLYIEIGAVSSITILSALVTARIYGLLIDRHKSNQLLILGTISNSAMHMVRPFISTPGGAVALNMVNELSTTGYNMPYMKGMFDVADSLPGYRIAYLSLMEFALALGSSLLFVIALLCVLSMGTGVGLKLTYVITAILTLAIGFNGFKRRFRYSSL